MASEDLDPSIPLASGCNIWLLVLLTVFSVVPPSKAQGALWKRRQKAGKSQRMEVNSKKCSLPASHDKMAHEGAHGVPPSLRRVVDARGVDIFFSGIATSRA